MREKLIRDKEKEVRDKIELKYLRFNSGNCINKVCEILNMILVGN